MLQERFSAAKAKNLSVVTVGLEGARNVFGLGKCIVGLTWTVLMLRSFSTHYQVQTLAFSVEPLRCKEIFGESPWDSAPVAFAGFHGPFTMYKCTNLQYTTVYDVSRYKRRFTTGLKASR